MDGFTMKNFGRVVRLALRYRLIFALSLVSALFVGVLWGANIGTVYPFAEIAFQGESLQQWLAREIGEAETTVDTMEAEVAKLRREVDRADDQTKPSLEAQISLRRSRILAEREAVVRYRWMQPYVRRYLPNDPFQTLALLVGLLLLGTVVKDAFLVANSVLIARIAQLGTFELRKLFYRRTLQMDLAHFSNEGTSDLMSRFTHDMNCVADGLTTLFGRLVREPLKAVACLVGAAFICWRLLLLSLIVAPIAGLLIQWLAKLIKRANRRAMEEMAQLYNTLEETFRGIKIVKAFTMEPQERWRFHLNSKQYYTQAMRIAQYDAMIRPVNEIMGILTICLALLGGAYLVISGETHLLGIRMSQRPLDLGALLVFYGLLAGVADPLRKLSDVFASLQRAGAASDRIYEKLDREPDVRDPEKPRALPRHHLDLVFDGVNFAYQPGKPVLEEINLRIRFGETIALVGPNGCGKSTLANLIPRFSDPTAGEIRLDGIPLGGVRLKDLRAQIGLVAQESLLFNDTVLKNIQYGSPQATREEVIAAAKQAHAHRFIEQELGEGYETIVGPSGGRLSGGQRQRVALARAILHDPSILILDEATSQVDLESEQLIQKVLERFVQNRTVVMITHRMSLLTMADRVVVMEAGRILDVGTHEQLIARCDLYRRLYQIQFDDLRESA